MKLRTAPPPAGPLAAEARVHVVEDAGPVPPDDPLVAAIDPIDRLIFRTELLAIASLRCPSTDPLFSHPHPIRNAIFVFPRTEVRIQHEGASAFLASPNLVTYYNRGDVVRRFAVDGAWDECDWFWIEPALLREIVARIEPQAADRPEIFPFSWGPSDARSYLEQRRALLHAATAEGPDRLYLEETMLWILDRLLQTAYRAHAAADGPTTRRQEDIVEAAKDVLTARRRDSLGLAALARQLACSPFSLSRTFRRRTGFTLSEYQHQLRLRRALDRVADSRARLTDVAFDLGYASQSHFTLFFRRAFGVTPAALRSRWMGVPVRLDPSLS